MTDKRPWENGMLKVGKSRRYLQNGDEAFFWLADTAWLLFHELDIEETYTYFKNRKEKGYTVILADFLHQADQANKKGEKALIDADFSRVDEESGFWSHIDSVLHLAEHMGLYMGILPVWGSSVVKGGHLTMENVDGYMEFITERYKGCPNIIWIVGGDVRGDVNMQVFDRMGEILKRNMPDHLTGYHPFGRTSSSIWFHDRGWLDFNMFQSGHRRYDQSKLNAWDDNSSEEEYYGEDNWRYVLRDYRLEPPKPTLDGEPSYEQIPQGLHDSSQPYWQAEDVRRYAYWSVFAGAMGHTYGDNSMMQFYADKRREGSYGAKDTWREAMHHAGSSQMSHLKALMLSVDYQSGHAADEMVMEGQGEKYGRISVFAGSAFIYCYAYQGQAFSLNLHAYSEKTMEIYWFDPESGVYSYVTEISGREKYEAVPIEKHPYGKENKDWVLVLKEASA